MDMSQCPEQRITVHKPSQVSSNQAVSYMNYNFEFCESILDNSARSISAKSEKCPDSALRGRPNRSGYTGGTAATKTGTTAGL